MTHRQLHIFSFSRKVIFGIATIQLMLGLAFLFYGRTQAQVENTEGGGTQCFIVDDVPLCPDGGNGNTGGTGGTTGGTGGTGDTSGTSATGETTGGGTGESGNTTTNATSGTNTTSNNTSATSQSADQTTSSLTNNQTTGATSTNNQSSTSTNSSRLATANPSPAAAKKAPSPTQSSAVIGYPTDSPTTSPNSEPTASNRPEIDDNAAPATSFTPAIDATPPNRETVVSQQLINDNPIEQPIVLAAAATVVPAVIVVAGPTAALLVVNSLQAVANIPNFILSTWTHLMVFFGLKRRRTPWGKVIDSMTSQPITGAAVTLSLADIEGHLKPLDRIVTDNEGRYGFLTAPGNYVIQVNKVGFMFPTRITRGVYTGHAFRVDAQQTLTLDLYCDPTEAIASIALHLRRLIILLERSRFLFLLLGTGLVAYSLFIQADLFNIVLTVLYMALWFNELLHRNSSRQTLKITDTTGRPIPFALFRLYDANTQKVILTKATDSLGEAYVLVPAGDYTIQIPSPRHPEGIKQKIHLPQGIIPKHMKIAIDY